MPKVKSITVVTEDNVHTTFYGEGSFSLVSTQTKVEGVAPVNWPWMSYVSAHLLVKPVGSGDGEVT